MLRKLDKLGYSGNYKGNFRALRDSTKGHSRIHKSKKQLILSLGSMAILKEVKLRYSLFIIVSKKCLFEALKYEEELKREA